MTDEPMVTSPGQRGSAQTGPGAGHCRSAALAVVLTMDFPTADAAEFLATLGYTGLAIDLEHGGQHLHQLPDLARACLLGGTDLVVKVAHDDIRAIRAATDAGASVIQLAGVTTVDDLTAAVAETRFPPNGQRGVGRSRDNTFGHHPGGYLAYAAQPAPMLVPFIESRAAVANCAAIASHEHVEAVFVGTFDLAMDCGYCADPGHRAVRALIATSEAAILDAGARLGASASTPCALNEAKARGASYVLVSQARQLSQAATTLAQTAIATPA